MVASLVLGTPFQGLTGATQYQHPAHLADYILGLITETNTTAGLSTPTTPASLGGALPGTPRAQGSNVVTINGWWKRALSAAETQWSVPAASDHQVGIPFAIVGGLTSGNPWDASSSDGQAAGTTGRRFDAVTTNNVSITTVTPNSLVVFAIASSADTASDIFTNIVAPSNLTSWTVHDQHHSTNNNGGGLLLASGVKVTAGNVNVLDWDFSVSSAWTGIALAFPPALTGGVDDDDHWGALTF